MTGAGAAAPLPDCCWPIDTSGVPDWDAPADPDDPDAGPLYTAADKARAEAFAGQTLRMLTGYRMGGCPVTVRPCARRWVNPTWRTYPALPGVGTPWLPISEGGQWLNVDTSGDGPCLHGVSVALPASAVRVTEVRVDGVPLPASAYRLDYRARLVRTDGQRWPLRQDLTAPDDAPDTWAVDYLPGYPVDALGAYYGGVVAGEYVKAMSGDTSCRLPSTVTQVQRQGITMTVSAGTFPDGKTGIRDVDMWLHTINPTGLLVTPSVWSPDTARGVRRR